ncbi:MAG: hypothetical protein IKF82_00670 [Bacilli bacterium]|nr:hypothetical protein [Bacilli bacterium]
MKDMNNLSDEEVQEQIQKLDKEIKVFNEETIPKILKILEEEQHSTVVTCYGLISIVNAILGKFGTKDLLEECMYYLQNNLDDLKEMPIEN